MNLYRELSGFCLATRLEIQMFDENMEYNAYIYKNNN